MVQKCIVCGKFLDLSKHRGPGRRKAICENIECQRTRKRAWQRDKMHKDPAYRENQKAAQKQWHIKHPAYWRDYRARHSTYTEQNRRQQRLRNARKRASAKMAEKGVAVAKMDEMRSQPIEKQAIMPGRYLLMPLVCGIATMDGIAVELTAITEDGP